MSSLKKDHITNSGCPRRGKKTFPCVELMGKPCYIFKKSERLVLVNSWKENEKNFEEFNNGSNRSHPQL